jgi:hypothetical protein
MPCACGGSGNDATAEYEVRLADGSTKIVKGKVEAEMAITAAGGGSIIKKVV